MAYDTYNLRTLTNKGITMDKGSKIFIGLILSISVILNIWLWAEKQSANFTKDVWKEIAESRQAAWYLVNRDDFFSRRLERALAVLHGHNTCSYQSWRKYPDTSNALLNLAKVWDDIQMEREGILYTNKNNNHKDLKKFKEYNYNEKIMPMAEAIVKEVCPKKTNDLNWWKDAVLNYLEIMNEIK